MQSSFGFRWSKFWWFCCEEMEQKQWPQRPSYDVRVVTIILFVCNHEFRFNWLFCRCAHISRATDLCILWETASPQNSFCEWKWVNVMSIEIYINKCVQQTHARRIHARWQFGVIALWFSCFVYFWFRMQKRKWLQLSGVFRFRYINLRLQFCDKT